MVVAAGLAESGRLVARSERDSLARGQRVVSRVTAPAAWVDHAKLLQALDIGGGGRLRGWGGERHIGYITN